MRTYITGASGFIGKHMVKYLEGQGHEVVKITRPIAKSLAAVPCFVEFSFIHLAAYGNHYDQKSKESIIRANILDLMEVLHFINRSDLVGIQGLQKFYNISTSAIQLPTDTLYSVSKRFGELMVESYNDPRFVNIRPYSVYGPGEADHRFIPTVIRALNSGETIKLDKLASHDWVYIDDFIKGMFHNFTNIGTGESYNNYQIVAMLERISNRQLKFEDAKLRNYDTDDWKAPDKSMPHIHIYEGLKQTYEWFTQKEMENDPHDRPSL